MFNNRFNSSKNDPLVEAVKTARADGDARRLAESMANDLFGVFSRKAVVREYLSDYDYALEEAYKCVKEEDKMADKDYDRDGKIETSKKEVWGSRLRAAKASGKYKGPVDEKKMWEGSGVSGEDPGMEVAKQAGARQQAQTPSSTPARTGNAAGATIAKAKDALNELTKPTPKTAMNAYYRAYDSDVQDGGEGKRTARLGRWKEKHLPGKSARNQKDTGKAELDDYDRKTVKKSGVLTKASQKDTKAEIKSRLGKHTKPKHLPEEQIDEISKELAGRYIKQADYKRSDSSFQSGKVYGKELATKRRTKQDVETSRKHNRDAFKREKGINTAVNKLTGKAKVAANEEIMKESIIAKLFAKHMKEATQIDEVSAFGQAFRAAGGKNFTFGGKQYSGARADGKTSSTPTPPSRPAGLGASKEIGDAGYKSDRTVSLKPIAEPGSAMAADNKPAPARPAPTPGWKAPAPVNQADTMKAAGDTPSVQTGTKAPSSAPLPPSRPASLGGGEAASLPKIDTGPKLNTNKPGLQESVQVGANKYRIV